MRVLVFLPGFTAASVALLCLFSAEAHGQTEIPPGLSDPDPIVRARTVELVGKRKMMSAEGEIATMAKKDPNAEVREAACGALAEMWAYGQIELLYDVSTNDPNAAVRAAAENAMRVLRNEPASSTTARPTVLPSSAEPATEPAEETSDRDRYKMPEIAFNKKEEETRVFAVGFGTMGGFGIAALDFRGRIPTGSQVLPWVGLELGGGWTPPGIYEFTTGPVGDVNDEDNKWRILSWAGSVLLYFHRMHYIPVRTGWDVGRGMYFILGYGFEHLNMEGFFSWGVEVGILYQPQIEDKIDNLVTCEAADNCEDRELWPLIPWIRFSLHFYLT